MIMFAGIANLKCYIHKRMKAFASLATKICARSKTQTIETALQGFARRQQVGNAPVLVRPACCNSAPRTLFVAMQPHGNTLCRTAAGKIENVRRDSPHVLFLIDQAIFAD